jgi:hypothetical protein
MPNISVNLHEKKQGSTTYHRSILHTVKQESSSDVCLHLIDGDLGLTSLDNGNPYPKPAIGALKSFCAAASSTSGESAIVVYM